MGVPSSGRKRRLINIRISTSRVGARRRQLVNCFEQSVLHCKTTAFVAL